MLCSLSTGSCTVGNCNWFNGCLLFICDLFWYSTHLEKKAEYLIALLPASNNVLIDLFKSGKRTEFIHFKTCNALNSIGL